MPGRIVRSVVVVGLVIGAVQTVRAPSSSAVAPASCATQFGPPDPALVPTPWPEDFSDSPQDIDDDGGTDLVVGVPAASADGRAGASVVDVHYSRFPGSTATVQRVGASYFQGVPAPAVGDGFGSAVAFADINDDPQARDFCQDLVIGVPGANGGRGEVIIAFGSVGGLDPAGAVVMHGTQAGSTTAPPLSRAVTTSGSVRPIAASTARLGPVLSSICAWSPDWSLTSRTWPRVSTWCPGSARSTIGSGRS